MTWSTRSILRLTLAVAALLGAATPIANPGPVADEDAIAYREVRIRKLHLVRPDLLPYPLAFEVVC